MTEQVEALWKALAVERDKLTNPQLVSESNYGSVYQQLVKLGAAQQLRGKYRRS